MENFWLQSRTICAYAVSLLALAEIVDLTIVAVAIPQMMGSLGANIDSIAMVTTSYIVAAAVFIMLSGLVVRKYGMKRVIMISGIVFCISSVLCGQATSLPEMIFFRLVQGIGGAFLPAVAQSYIARRFQGQEQAKMMIIFSLVVVMGPILGPVLGGILVANMSWRWIFYVNVPICVVAVTLIAIFMKNEPIKKIKIDYISFAFMALGVGLLEYFIDEGNRKGWFGSIEMIIILTSAIILIGFFIWRGLLGSSVVKLSIFKNTNFVLSCFSMFIFMMFATATFAYFPTMMQDIYNYPVDDAGYITVPRGLTAMITAMFIPKLSTLVGERVVMATGLVAFAVGSFMQAYFGAAVSVSYVVTSMVFQGFGMMCFFIPIMQICFIGIPDEENSDASGVFNFFRNFSASVGTSISATIISHQMQVNCHDLGEHVSPYANGFQWWVQNLSGLSETMQVAIANTQVQQQSAFISYLDNYYMCAVGMIIIAWTPFILKKRKLDHSDQSTNMMH
jgi:DHA2 family multidrug resistance protein